MPRHGWREVACLLHNRGKLGSQVSIPNTDLYLETWCPPFEFNEWALGYAPTSPSSRRRTLKAKATSDIPLASSKMPSSHGIASAHRNNEEKT